MASTPPSRTSRADISSASSTLGEAASAGVEQFQRRAALRTGDRLGVEPPIGRIAVFRQALRTHRERGHRRPRTIVGQLANDRPSRAAVGAIGKRVAIAPLERVVDFGQAQPTGGQIGRQRRLRRGRFVAVQNLKFALQARPVATPRRDAAD